MLVQQICPHQCFSCYGEIADAGGICPECRASVHFLRDTICDACAVPLPGLLDQDTPGSACLCDACYQSAPAWGKARSALLYDGAARRIVSQFKNGVRSDMAEGLAAFMLKAGRDILDVDSVLVPVPLHWRRRFTRRFNQSATLARLVARQVGAQYSPDVLQRTGATPYLRQMNAQARTDALEGKIAVKRCDAIKGRSVVLVDDVLTTGATATACTHALLKGGAGQVNLLTLARVARRL